MLRGRCSCAISEPPTCLFTLRLLANSHSLARSSVSGGGPLPFKPRPRISKVPPPQLLYSCTLTLLCGAFPYFPYTVPPISFLFCRFPISYRKNPGGVPPVPLPTLQQWESRRASSSMTNFSISESRSTLLRFGSNPLLQERTASAGRRLHLVAKSGSAPFPNLLPTFFFSTLAQSVLPTSFVDILVGLGDVSGGRG